MTFFMLTISSVGIQLKSTERFLLYYTREETEHWLCAVSVLSLFFKLAVIIMRYESGVR